MFGCALAGYVLNSAFLKLISAGDWLNGDSNPSAAHYMKVLVQ